jgi:hypothetical protein
MKSKGCFLRQPFDNETQTYNIQGMSILGENKDLYGSFLQVVSTSPETATNHSPSGDTSILFTAVV